MPDRYRLVSLDRAIDILSTFTATRRELSFTEIMQSVRLNKAATKRLLATLVARKLLMLTEQGKYALGSKLIVLGHLAGENITLLRVGRPEVTALNTATGDTVILVQWTGQQQFYLEKLEGTRTVRITSTVGTEREPYYGLGKTILAYLDRETVERLLPERIPSYTERTITDRDAFLEELARIRDRGYAVDNQEYIEGVIGIGAPIFYYDGSVAGLIGVLLPAVASNRQRLEQISVLTRRSAKRISAALGG